MIIKLVNETIWVGLNDGIGANDPGNLNLV
jgi:hypothetical protein